MMRISLCFSVFFSLANSVCAAWAADSDWSWIKVEPQNDRGSEAWSVTKGTANVKIEGQTFQADLKLAPDVAIGADIRLKGTISNGEISATETVLNSDEKPSSIRGYYQKSRNKTDPWETDRMIFTQGATFIGVTRLIQVKPLAPSVQAACNSLAMSAANSGPTLAVDIKAQMESMGCPIPN